MRWMIGIFAVLVTLWCGWWVAGRYVVLSQAERLIEEQRASGAVLDLPGLGLSGFPSRFDITTDSISWRDPSGRFAYEAGAAHSYAMSWKPWHLIFWLPDSQKISLEGQTIEITGQKPHASLRASPSVDLPLALATFSGEALTLISSQFGTLGLSIDSLRLEAETAAPGAHPYRLGAKLTAIRPDPALTAALAQVEVLQMPEKLLPDVIESLHLDARLELSAALDRHAGQTAPQLLAADLRDLSLIWGDLRMVAQGAISPDDEGLAAGTIALSVRGWEQLPRLLVAAGLIEPQMSGIMTNMLRGLASGGSDPTELRIDLVFRDGWVNFGPLPLGPSPKLGAPPTPAG